MAVSRLTLVLGALTLWGAGWALTDGAAGAGDGKGVAGGPVTSQGG